MKCSIWISCMLFCFANTFAQPREQLLCVAKEAQELGNYSLAAQLYNRIIFFNKDSSIQNEYFQLANCYYMLHKYDEAANSYDMAYSNHSEDSIRKESLFKKLICLMQLEKYDLALVDLYNFPELNTRFEKNRYRFYEASIYLMKGNVEQSLQLYDSLFKSNINQEKYQVLKKNFMRKNRMKPNTAKYLSYVLPGLGQLYMKDYKNALNSFILVSGFVTLFYYNSLQVSAISSYLGIIPWLQRYYKGGAERCYINAVQKKQHQREYFLKKVVEIL
jgi:tetratricopeptide (TPR) repeat protein